MKKKVVGLLIVGALLTSLASSSEALNVKMNNNDCQIYIALKDVKSVFGGYVPNYCD